jgi:hypothetical protein
LAPPPPPGCGENHPQEGCYAHPETASGTMHVAPERIASSRDGAFQSGSRRSSSARSGWSQGAVAPLASSTLASRQPKVWHAATWQTAHCRCILVPGYPLLMFMSGAGSPRRLPRTGLTHPGVHRIPGCFNEASHLRLYGPHGHGRPSRQAPWRHPSATPRGTGRPTRRVRCPRCHLADVLVQPGGTGSPPPPVRPHAGRTPVGRARRISCAATRRAVDVASAQLRSDRSRVGALARCRHLSTMRNLTKIGLAGNIWRPSTGPNLGTFPDFRRTDGPVRPPRNPRHPS